MFQNVSSCHNIYNILLLCGSPRVFYCYLKRLGNGSIHTNGQTFAVSENTDLFSFRFCFLHLQDITVVYMPKEFESKIPPQKRVTVRSAPKSCSGANGHWTIATRLSVRPVRSQLRRSVHPVRSPLPMDRHYSQVLKLYTIAKRLDS